MELNKIYNMDCVEGMNSLVPDESIDLIIADPPYFKVVGEKWDYMWRTEEDYLEWSKVWIKEAVRVIRIGGSFYLFGYFRMLSRLLQILEDAGLELRQQIILNKGMQAVSGRATKNYKIFPNVTESILFLYKDPKPFAKSFLRQRQKDLCLTAKEINEKLGVKSNGGGMWSIYTGKNVCKQLPTEELWNKLQIILDFDIPYSKISQTYNAQLGITDVWSDINFYSEKRFHPTQKPQKLIDRLVIASSNKGDIVLDPFMGGGSTAISCVSNSRNYIGFELDKEYYDKSIERFNCRQLSLPI
ncbi:DNA-methyltransferase [Campylobacter concisus]|uniref:DNA-methyltransferase n=1 Tax=Campylobacter concisus TaxID=199 RepID=UPI0011E834AC|nr:site-specific DNA-methyltransferase [Campylobacter concisus]